MAKRITKDERANAARLYDEFKCPVAHCNTLRCLKKKCVPRIARYLRIKD